MTVVGVGDNLGDQYKTGDRFIVQADIYDKGVNYAYGYMIQGGMSQYGVIDQRILNGDHGNYLLPVQQTTGYAESALAEPWACVIAAYELKYRTALKNGGFRVLDADSAAVIQLDHGLELQVLELFEPLAYLGGAFVAAGVFAQVFADRVCRDR